MSRQRRNHGPEFKREAVALVVEFTGIRRHLYNRLGILRKYKNSNASLTGEERDTYSTIGRSGKSL